jgi:hypothetical protein
MDRHIKKKYAVAIVLFGGVFSRSFHKLKGISKDLILK